MEPRPVWLAFCLSMAALLVTGCGDTHVSLEKERIALGRELMNTMISAKNPNEMFDKAPQVDSIAARLEKLAERRGKLKPANGEERTAIGKLRRAEAEEMQEKAKSWQADMTPQNMFSGGMPDMAKMQKFQAAFMRLSKAHLAYDPQQFGGATLPGTPPGVASPGEGGLLVAPGPGTASP